MPAPEQPDPTTAPAPLSPPDKADKKSGRRGVTRAAAETAVDTWIKRTGKSPSVRELRLALGGTGSLSTLGPLLREILADRLLAGAEPEPDAPETQLLKTLKSTMRALATEAGAAAEEVVAAGVRDADAKVAAAEAIQRRAEAQALASDQARERAEGRVSALEEHITELKQSLTERQQAEQSALTREAKVQDEAAALDRALARVQAERDQLEAENTTDRQTLRKLETAVKHEQERVQSLEKTQAVLTMERDDARACVQRLEDAVETTNSRIATLERDAETACTTHATAQADLQARNDTLQARIESLNADVARLDQARLAAEAAATHAVAERNAVISRESALESIQAVLVNRETLLEGLQATLAELKTITPASARMPRNGEPG